MIYLGQDPIGISNIPESYPELVQNVAALNEEIISKAPVVYREASGDIVTISDGADGMPLKDCTVQIDPVQDLHGQSNPYPAGGGANKMPPPVNISFPSGLTVTNKDGLLTISGTASSGMIAAVDVGSFTFAESGQKILLFNSFTGGTIYFYNMDTQVDYFSLSSTNRVVAESSMSALKGKTITKYRILISSETTFSNATIGVVVCGTSENPSVFAPYSNICPISGWTGAVVSRTGKNLCKQVIQGFPYTTNETIYIDNDTESAVFYAIAGQTYCRSASVEFNRNMLAHVATSEITTGMPYTDIINQSNGTGATWTATWTGWTVWYCSSSKNTSMDESLQVEIGSMATPYAPYVGTTYPINWQTAAGTVYHGVMDMTAKTLTVDYASVTYDGSEDEEWAYYSIASGNLFRIVQSDRKMENITSNAATRAKYICNSYAVAANSTTGRINGTFSGSNNNVDFVNDSYSTVDAFRAYLAQNPIQFVYPLAETVVYSLIDVPDIQTLLGENNLWSDTGAINLTYPADTKTYVDESLPAVPVQDVQINGTSILSEGVANVPIASSSNLGVIGINSSYGININSSGKLYVNASDLSACKEGNHNYRPITPSNQHQSVFYGLAKAAGDTTQASSSNVVGTYTADASAAIRTMLGAVGSTDYATSNTAGVFKLGGALKSGSTPGWIYLVSSSESGCKTGTNDSFPVTPSVEHYAVFYGLSKIAGVDLKLETVTSGVYPQASKTAIQTMLGVESGVSFVEQITGTTPVIAGIANTRYVCGEVTSISITPPATGIIDVTFTSGTTPAVLTIPNTVTFPAWFDPTALDANKVYEINIVDGVRGVVTTW